MPHRINYYYKVDNISAALSGPPPRPGVVELPFSCLILLGHEKTASLRVLLIGDAAEGGGERRGYHGLNEQADVKTGTLFHRGHHRLIINQGLGWS
jgi:hypothetical protein